MIHQYFKHRFHLGNLYSRFQCEPGCSRPGCGSRDMQVPVTVFDLIGAALHGDESVEAVYKRHYYAGVLPVEGFDLVKSVSLKIRKPCPFLDRHQCSIYEVRPLSCILFPEYPAVNGTLQSLAARTEYRDYLCFRSPFTVPEERLRIIHTLAEMLRRELLVSDFYLFGHSPFRIDFSALTEELVHDVREQSNELNHGASPEEEPIPFDTFDRVFQQILGECRPLSELGAGIGRLDIHEQRGKLFGSLNDKKHLQALSRREEDPPLVFRYSNGALEARRQSFSPRERMFLW